MAQKSGKSNGEDERMPTQPREWPTKVNWLREEVMLKNHKIARIVQDWAKDPNPDLRKTQRLLEIQALALESVNLLIQAKPNTGTGSLKMEE